MRPGSALEFQLRSLYDEFLPRTWSGAARLFRRGRRRRLFTPSSRGCGALTQPSRRSRRRIPRTRPPPSNTSVLVTTLSSEASIVADDEHRAGEVDELRLEQLQRLDVEIVRRLVEHEHVGRPGEQPREQQAVALAA